MSIIFSAFVCGLFVWSSVCSKSKYILRKPIPSQNDVRLETKKTNKAKNTNQSKVLKVHRERPKKISLTAHAGQFIFVFAFNLSCFRMRI